METTIPMETNIAQEIEMLEQTNAYLDDHISVWIPIPIISNYKNKVHSLIPALKSMLDGTEAESSNVHMGQAVLHLKKQIADKMDILDDTLEAYADDIGDEELRKQAANYYSDYFWLPYEDFVTKVREMVELLEGHIDQMHDYGLVHDQIDDVKLNMDEYEIGLGKTPTFNLSGKLAKGNVDSMLNEARTYAEKLDKVMKRFKRSDVTFYNGYLAARTMIDHY